MRTLIGLRMEGQKGGQSFDYLYLASRIRPLGHIMADPSATFERAFHVLNPPEFRCCLNFRIGMTAKMP